MNSKKKFKMKKSGEKWGKNYDQGQILQSLKDNIKQISILPKTFRGLILGLIFLYIIYIFGFIYPPVFLDKLHIKPLLEKQITKTNTPDFFIKNKFNKDCRVLAMENLANLPVHEKFENTQEYWWKVENCGEFFLRVTNGKKDDIRSKESVNLTFGENNFTVFSYGFAENNINLTRYAQKLLYPIYQTRLFTPQKSSSSLGFLDKTYYLDVSCNTPNTPECRLWQVKNNELEILYEFKNYEKVSFIKENVTPDLVKIEMKNGAKTQIIFIKTDDPNLVEIIEK